jgi:hypothetical protein
MPSPKASDCRLPKHQLDASSVLTFLQPGCIVMKQRRDQANAELQGPARAEPRGLTRDQPGAWHTSLTPRRASLSQTLSGFQIVARSPGSRVDVSFTTSSQGPPTFTFSLSDTLIRVPTRCHDRGCLLTGHALVTGINGPCLVGSWDPVWSRWARQSRHLKMFTVWKFAEKFAGLTLNILRSGCGAGKGRTNWALACLSVCWLVSICCVGEK